MSEKNCSETEKPCCSVEAVVSVDDRGQMVLPKDVRKKLGLEHGDKLALVSWNKEGEECCIVLMKADSLGDAARGMLGPLAK